MFDSGNIVVWLGRIVHPGRLIGFTVFDERRAANIKLYHHDGGVHAHVSDFHLHFRGARAVDFLRGEHARAHEGCSGVDTGFRNVVFFPTTRTRIPVVCGIRFYTAEKRTNGHFILIRRSGHILAFGVGRTMVRVSIVLVTDTVDEGDIPGVHAEQVVQLVETQLVHLRGFPVRGPHDGEREALPFDIGGHVRIGEHFEYVAGLVAVVNPRIREKHRIPHRVIFDGS